MNSFKFKKGDIVIQNNAAMGLKNTPGVIETSGWNPYGPPLFPEGAYWFPLYHVTNLQLSELKGQDIHEDCLRLATDGERDKLLSASGILQSEFTGHPFGYK